MSMDPVTAGLDLITLSINKLFPDKSEADRIKLAQEILLVKTQTDTNLAEASNPSVFVAGWRPFIGWICGCGLAYQFLIYPVLVAWIPKIVQLDLGTLLTLLGGMLGLGVLRTQEKIKGVS